MTSKPNAKTIRAEMWENYKHDRSLNLMSSPTIAKMRLNNWAISSDCYSPIDSDNERIVIDCFIGADTERLEKLAARLHKEEMELIENRQTRKRIVSTIPNQLRSGVEAILYGSISHRYPYSEEMVNFMYRLAGAVRALDESDAANIIKEYEAYELSKVTIEQPKKSSHPKKRTLWQILTLKKA